MSPIVIGSIDKFHLPNPRGLQVKLRSSSDISLIIGAPGIDLAKLEKLGLVVTHYDEEGDFDELAMLFEAAPNIDKLICGNTASAITALKLFFNLENLYKKARGLHFRYPGSATTLGVGDERELSILGLISEIEEDRLCALEIAELA